MLNIKGIKTLNGYYISENPNETYGQTRLGNYIINGDKPEKTFHTWWVKVKKEPCKIQVLKPQPSINHRYVLIDESLSDKFPLEYKREDVAYYDEDDYGWTWKDSYSHLESLYKLIYDKQEPTLEDIEFTYETIIELDDLKEIDGFSYPVQKTEWRKDGLTNITEKDVNHRLIDRIIFPKIVLSQLPSKLSSEQMYKIVREYVKDKIDPKVAIIKSDYKFCFEVHKLIELADPYSVKKEIKKSNGRSYAKPRYNEKYYKTRSVKVFEMTHAGEMYRGYTPIAEMVADNLEELQIKVDKYLHDLITMINTPLKECSCCRGYGVELTDDVKKYVIKGDE